jgi:60 kDa SS-A/Ro ribonucleoprotein
MAKLNVWTRMFPVQTHEGAVAQKLSPKAELRRTVLTCLLWEDTFYEKGNAMATRLAALVRQCTPEDVAALAREARAAMHLRHVPLFLTRELARRPGAGPLVADTLESVIQRADELGEFVALYWKEKKQPLSAGVKRGLARAFTKFDAYQLAKYNRDSAVKLRDVLFLCHAAPKDEAQATAWKRLVDGTLEAPDTWEVALSARAGKKETFERLLEEGKLGGMAVLRNLRLMVAAGVSSKLIRERLDKGVARALPFRFVTAARYAPKLEDAIEAAMFKGIAALPKLEGATGLLVDVSGSMDARLANKSETTRMDAAAGLAILLREKGDAFYVATFSDKCVELPARRGFALRDGIVKSQEHASTQLKRALDQLRGQSDWQKLDRLIVITDEQTHDGILPAWTPRAYLVNVAPYKHGLSYGNGWTHVDGWSERIVEYMAAAEGAAAA